MLPWTTAPGSGSLLLGRAEGKKGAIADSSRRVCLDHLAAGDLEAETVEDVLDKAGEVTSKVGDVVAEHPKNGHVVGRSPRGVDARFTRYPRRLEAGIEPDVVVVQGDYRVGRPVVLVEVDRGRRDAQHRASSRGQVSEQLDRSTPEAEESLVIVAHDGDRSTPGEGATGQVKVDGLLQQVRVLVLIHQHVLDGVHESIQRPGLQVVEEGLLEGGVVDDLLGSEEVLVCGQCVADDRNAGVGVSGAHAAGGRGGEIGRHIYVVVEHTLTDVGEDPGFFGRR